MKIGVIGDTLLDVDLIGDADRLAPDGPVPVVSVRDSIRRPGGAGLVATLLAHDGVDVALVTALADDAEADELRTTLQDRDVELATASLAGATPVKTRLRAGGHTVARIDSGDAFGHLDPFRIDALTALGDCDAIVVADYGRGVASDPLLRRLLESRGPGTPIVWDPHPRGPRPVPTAALVTPNAAEAAAFGHVVGESARAAALAAAALVQRWQVPAVAVTLGESGAVLARRGVPHPHVVPTSPVAAADSCGAGDRLAASAAVALARGEDIASALEAGVECASSFISGGGVAALHGEPERRLSPAESVVARARATHARGGTVVATRGSFDAIDAGVVRLLAAARCLGDCLIVLDEDPPGAGARRPTAERREILAALRCVDAVGAAGEGAKAEALLDQLRPDVWVVPHGAETGPAERAVISRGGRVVTVAARAPHPVRDDRDVAPLSAVG